jgi:hypothetical protein
VACFDEPAKTVSTTLAAGGRTASIAAVFPPLNPTTKTTRRMTTGTWAAAASL